MQIQTVGLFKIADEIIHITTIVGIICKSPILAIYTHKEEHLSNSVKFCILLLNIYHYCQTKLSKKQNKDNFLDKLDTFNKKGNLGKAKI